MKMCRTILPVIVSLLWLFPCRAQTFSEWWQQNKTQKKYLALQIAKLQLYLGALKKGYQIVNTGLTTISNIKDGDFNQHKTFFNDLLLIKPIIRDYSKTKETLKIIHLIRDKTTAIKNSLAKNSMYSADEKSFMKRQLDNMLEALLNDLSLFHNTVNPHTLQMDDSERIKRIDKVHNEVILKKEWINRCATDYNLLFIQRWKNIADTDLLQQLQ